ncbi:MAG: deoxyribonuclease IV [Chloroflexi bacterium]|nr:deoxyribonuclease IV [Chloroflexota bacterium]
MRLGAHMSIAGGIHLALERAQSVGCDSAQVFVKPNRAWAAKPLAQHEIDLFRAGTSKNDIHPIVGHASYLLNLATSDDALWKRSCDTLALEMRRCYLLGIPWIVLHPGSHTGSGEGVGLARVIRALDQVHDATSDIDTMILLETTAGQGSSLGYRFEQLGSIIQRARNPERLGVCFDTCHVFAAGYELRTRQGYTETMEQFSREIGMDRLKVIHINDSKGDIGSRLDRHEHIGRGMLGLNAFRFLFADRRLANRPGLLETPKSNDLHEDRENLQILRGLIKEITNYPASNIDN